MSSKQVDERIVQMQFDNRQFEQNVKTSMSTLDKLKKSLKLEGAVSGLESVDRAAKNVDFRTIEQTATQAGFHIRDVWLKVSSVFEYQVAGKIVEAGKQMVKAFTIDPIKTGFQEYETQINAVQTILANTSKQGTTLGDVTKALDELNTYADKTIYNFTEMTKNIGTFTASGLELDPAVKAIQGIANLAAVSGSTSQQASTAMYQLSQALSSGTVQLMDWNSVVNAGMGGKVFQDAIMETAKGFDNIDQSVVKAYESGESFRSLLDATGGYGRWFTSDLLSQTLQKFTKTGAVEYLVEMSGATKENMVALQHLGDSTGYASDEFKEMALSITNGDEAMAKTISDTLSMADMAERAATEVKTFSQLMDTLKESAQSGWTETWETIIGNFDEAKELFTYMSDSFGAIIGQSSAARNAFVSDVLDSKWDKFIHQVNDAGVSTEVFNEQLIASAEASGKIDINELIKEHGSLNKVISKGLIPTEIYTAALTELGGSANEAAGEATKTADELAKANEYLVKQGDNLTVIGRKYNMTWQELYELNKDIISDPNLIYPDQILKLSDAQLENMGYTEKQIGVLKSLAEEAAATGTPMNELIEAMGKPSGRELLVDTVRNALAAISEIVNAIGGGFSEAFDTKEAAQQVYNIIEAINELSKRFVEYLGKADEAGSSANKLKRTFRGLFSILDIIKTVIVGGINVALKLMSKVTGNTNVDVLDLTASTGDMIYEFSQWLKSGDKVINFLTGLSDKLIDGAAKVKEWIDAFLALPEVQQILEKLSEKFEDLKTVGENAIDGLKLGLEEGITSVPDILVEIGEKILEKIKEVLGIHSPSTKMEEVGENTIEGFNIGLTNGIDGLEETITTISKKVEGWFEDFDWGTAFSVIISSGLVAGLLKLISIFDKFAAPAEGLGDTLSGVGTVLEESAEGIGLMIKNTAKVIKSFSKVLNSIAFENVTNGLKNIAIAIAILVGCIVVLVMLPEDQVLDAIGMLGAIMGLFVLLALAITVMTKVASKADANPIDTLKLTAMFVGVGAMFVAMGAAMLMMAAVVKIVGGMDETAINNGMSAIAAFTGVILLLMYSTKLVSAGKLKSFSKVLLSISACIVLMTVACYALGKMDSTEFEQGLIAVGLFAAIIGALMYATNLVSDKEMKSLSKVLLSMSACMVLMGAVVYTLGNMDSTEFEQGMIGVGLFTGLVAVLIAITDLVTEKDMKNLSKILVSMGVCMLLMGIVVYALGNMDPDKFKQGMIGVGLFAGILTGLVAMTKLASDKEMKSLSVVLLSMGGCMILMAAAVFALGIMKPETLKKGMVCITLFAGIIVGLVAATKLVTLKDLAGLAGTLLAMSVSIALMALVAIILGLIPIENLKKGIIAVGLLGLVVAAMVSAARGVRDLKGTMLAMAAVIAVMALSIAALSFIDQDKLKGATIALGAIMAIFTGLLAVAGTVKGALGVLIVMTVAIAVMAGSIVLIAKIAGDKALESAAALSLVMITMTGCLAILAAMGSMMAKALLGVFGLLLMAAPLGAFAYILSKMQDVKNAIDNAIALSVLAGVMSLLLLPLCLVGVIIAASSGLALLGILGLLLMAAPLGAFVYVLSKMQDIKNAMDNALVLSALATVMTLLLIPLTVIGLLAPAAAAGVMALTLMAVPLLAFIGVLAVMEGVNNAMANSLILILLMTTMTGLLERLAAIAPMLAIATASLYAFTALMVALSGLVVAMGALATEFPQLETFVEAGIPLLVLLANGVGQIAGAFIGGLAEGVMASLPMIGTQMSMFMMNLMPFIIGAKMVDDDVIKGVTSLVGMMLLLTGASLIESLTSWLTGGSSMTDFGKDLAEFGPYIKKFADSVKGIDPVTVEAAANAGKILAEMASSLPNSGGIAGFFAGENDMDTFGFQLVSFGRNLKAYSLAIAGMDSEAVVNSATAGKALAELADTVPNAGGVAAFFAGENSIQDWGFELVSFGHNLKAYATAVAGIDSESVVNSATAGKALAELADTVPNCGGVAGFFAGENSIQDWGFELVSFGHNIKAYATAVTGIDLNAVENSTIAGNALVKLADTLPNTGGVVSWFTGDNDLGTFGDNLVLFGEDFVSYSNYMKDVDSGVVTATSDAAQSIVTLANSLPEDGGWFSDEQTLSDFGKELVDFGEEFNKYYESVADINTGKLTGVTAQTSKLVELSKDMSGIDSDAMSEYADGLSNLGKANVDGFIEAFEGSYDRAESAANGFIESFNSGVKSKEQTTITIFTKLVSSTIKTITDKTYAYNQAATDIMTAFGNGILIYGPTIQSILSTITLSGIPSIMNHYTSYEEAGKYLVQGFALGIDEQTWEAEAKAAAMATAAYEAAMEALDAHSPSKLFEEVGSYIPAGFAIGIGSLTDKVKQSSVSMAETAINNTKDAMSIISRIAMSDDDIQPTIRPVVDMGNLSSSTFSINASIDALVSRPVESLSSLLLKTQADINASNREVVQAVNSLREDLNTFYEADGPELALYMDSKKVASTIASPMNRELSILAKRGR